jgi:DNA-binding NtrC family response regulator
MLNVPSQATNNPSDLIADSPAMREVVALAQKAAASNAAILLHGESGTGKATLAAAIHRWSPRAGGPLIRVDCGGLAPELLESELFGAAPTATGDQSQKVGRLEAAHTGTLFLDDVHLAGPVVQSKLVRVLQDRQYELIGDARPLTVDVRVIGATPKDIVAEIAAGRFREDLFWRLNVLPIHVPPLRRRREDVAALAKHFVEIFNQANDRRIKRIAPAALAALQQYGWPGNVRELQTYIERAVVLADGDELTIELLPGVVSGQQKSEMGAFRGADPKSLIEEFVHNGITAAPADAEDLQARIVNPVERELIVQVLQACSNVQKKAADRLGMNRNTLHKKMKEYGIGDSEA